MKISYHYNNRNVRFEKSENGEKYIYTDERGEVVIDVHASDSGLMVCLIYCNTDGFLESRELPSFDGMNLNVYLRGSSYVENGQYDGFRDAGSAVIMRPWGRTAVLRSAVPGIHSLGIVLLKRSFRMEYAPNRSDWLIDELILKYTGRNLAFRMDDVCLSYCYGIEELSRTCDPSDERINRLVSGLMCRLYSTDEEAALPEDYEDHVEADTICMDILSDLAKECDMELICRERGLDKYRVNRLFKRRYGTTPYAFHKRHRLDRSAGLLLAGETNMGRVAAAIGYSSESKFATSFKQQFGIRPKHFAERMEAECAAIGRSIESGNQLVRSRRTGCRTAPCRTRPSPEARSGSPSPRYPRS